MIDYIVLFFDMLLRDSITVEKVTGFNHQILLTQAVLETGWGRHIKGNNLYGIKDTDFYPDEVIFLTHEEVDGELVKIRDDFEQYDSYLESMLHYTYFISNKGLYQDCLEFIDEPENYFCCLAETPYATDSEYGDKLLAVLKSVQKYEKEYLHLINNNNQ